MPPIKVLTADEPPIVFAPADGAPAPDVVVPWVSLATGAARWSPAFDLATRYPAERPSVYRWRLRVKTATAPALGRSVRLYVATSNDGVTFDGALAPAGGAAATEDVFRNVTLAGAPLETDTTAVGATYARSGELWLRARHVIVGLFNDTGVALSGTGADLELRLTPVPDVLV